MERIRYTHHKDFFFLELLNSVEFEAGLVSNSGYDCCEFASDFLDVLQLEEDGTLRLDSKFEGFGGFRIWGFVDLKIVDKGLAMALAMMILQFCNLNN